MVDKSKREFFSKYFLREISEVIAGFDEGVREADFNNFFSSHESNYVLTPSYPDEFLLESARRLGIETEGRETIEITKDLFKKKGGY